MLVACMVARRCIRRLVGQCCFSRRPIRMPKQRLLLLLLNGHLKARHPLGLLLSRSDAEGGWQQSSLSVSPLYRLCIHIADVVRTQKRRHWGCFSTSGHHTPPQYRYPLIRVCISSPHIDKMAPMHSWQLAQVPLV